MRSGERTAVIAGHDWGAPVAWHAALLRPDRFRAVVGLSVPYRPRGGVARPRVMPQTDEAFFYQLYFQKPGVAEAELEADAGSSLRKILYSGSGDVPQTQPRRRAAPASAWCRAPAAFSPGCRTRRRLPAWLSAADLDFYAQQFKHSGFRGGLNWYRNIDRNWELMAPFAGASVTVPALYMAGDLDLVVSFPRMKEVIADLPRYIPQLRGHDHAAGLRPLDAAGAAGRSQQGDDRVLARLVMCQRDYIRRSRGCR